MFETPRNPSDVADAAILVAREDGVDVAEKRLQDELNSVPNDLGDDYWEAEKKAIQYALSKIRKTYSDGAAT